MFLKSNTKTFIHTTHFLFNLLDPKEFKAKFYWPISEKKAENSYRSAAVDFINNIITKHNLAQEKVKLVSVVHPCGRKFMSLILSLIVLVTKEIMRRRRIPEGKSFDIDKVTKVVSDIKEIENELVTSIANEIKVVKSKTLAIEELIKHIFPPEDFPMPFNDLIKSWHEVNKVLIANLKTRDERIDSVYKKTAELQETAKTMLAPQVYDTKMPPLEVITEVAEFYKNAGLTADEDYEPDLNFPWLITQLHLVFPSILNYVSNFSLDPSDNKEGELKELHRLSAELIKIEEKIRKFAAVFRKKVPDMIARLTIAKEARQSLKEGDQSIDDTEKEANRKIEMDKLAGLLTPKSFFDVSKNCLKHVVVNKNRMPLFEDERDEKENIANETKLYRSVKSPYVKNSKMNQTVMAEMAPPNQQPRRRLDPMALLERATSNAGLRNRHDATSKYTGTIPKNSRSAPKFSSTLMSPDLRQPAFNCSVVSVIAQGSPAIDSPGNLTRSLTREASMKSSNRISTDHLLSAQFGNFMELSPRGGLSQPARSEGSFKVVPKIALNDETLTQSAESTGGASCTTLVNQTGDVASETFSFGSVMMPDDENLFNISDSIMKGVED